MTANGIIGKYVITGNLFNPAFNDIENDNSKDLG